MWTSNRVVQYIRVSKINDKAVDKLQKQLVGMTKKNTVSILLGISSGIDGKIVPVEQIGEMLRSKVKKDLGGELHTPIVTYAEEAALNAGLHLLMQGDVKLAHPMSRLGNIGSYVKPWMVKHFMHDTVMAQIKTITIGNNKVRLDRFEEHKPEDIEWAHNLINKFRDRILEETLKKRDAQISFLDKAK